MARMSGCQNCDENEATENGALCEDCREEMWSGERTHRGRLGESIGEKGVGSV